MKEYTVTFPEDQFHKLANLLQLICVAGLQFYGTGSAIPDKHELHPIWRTLISASIGSAQKKEA